MATQFNFKTATPDTSFPSGAFLFGADSQSASDPSIYSSDAYLNYLVTVASAWSAAQTFTSAAPQLTLGVNATTLGSVKLFGNTSGDATLRPTAAAGTATVCTLPATTTTLAGLAVVQTFSAANTFTSAAPQLTLGVNTTTLGSIKMFGNTSGDVTLQPSAVAGTATTLTLPATTSTLAGLAIGQTFTATQTITPAANTNALAVTGYSVTGSGTTAMFDLSGTWNTSGVASAIKLDITNTASANLSSYIDCRIGGTKDFQVSRTTGGSGLWFQQGTPTTSNYNIFVTASQDAITLNAVNGVYFALANSSLASIRSARLLVGNSLYMGFGSDLNGGGSTRLYENAAAILAVRGAGSTSPAAINCYTYGASPPSAPSASMALLYADTSGGKIRLMALFPSGAAQQIAIEP